MLQYRLILIFVSVALGGSLASRADSLSSPPAPAGAFSVDIKVDVTTALGPVNPIWRFFGADETNYATMKDGQKLCRRIGRAKT